MSISTGSKRIVANTWSDKAREAAAEARKEHTTHGATDRMDVERTHVHLGGKEKRTFYTGKLNKKASDWLNQEGEKRAEATVDHTDSGPYLNRIDAHTKGKGFGKEMLNHIKDHLASQGHKSLRTYVEHTNMDSRHMIEKAGGKEVEKKKEGSYYEMPLKKKEQR
jgi:GNAT superfamily N-acetyltransferase